MDDSGRTIRRVALWLFGLGLLLAALGQLVLSFARDWALLGFIAYAAGLLLLVTLVRLIQGKKKLMRMETALIQLFGRIRNGIGLPVLMVIAACLAVVAATSIAQNSHPPGDYWLAFLVWLVGLFLLGFALIYLPARQDLTSLRARLLNARGEILIVAGLTLLAFFLRVINLQNIPYPFGGDEGSVGIEATHILAGQSANMFVSGWSSEPMMSFLPFAASVAVFGHGIFALRLFAVLVGTLTIPALYLLARSLFNQPIALLSAFLLAVMNTHIHFSRIAVNNIVNPFYACLVFWLIARALETRKLYWFAAAGMAGGASIYSYAGTRFVLIIAGIYLLYAFATDHELQKEWLKLVVFGLSASVVFFPIAVYFWQHSDIAFARFNQVGIFQNGWLAHEMVLKNETAPSIFARLFLNSFLVIIATPAAAGFLNSPLPLLDIAWSFFFVIGLVFSMTNLCERRQVLLQLWFWGVMLVAGAMTVPPLAAERIAMIFPVMALFIAFGIWNVVSLLDKIISLRPLATRGLIAIMAFLLAATSLNFYFFEYTPNYYYADANSEVGMELGQYLATVPRQAKLYFLGEPRMFIGFPSIPFLSRNLDAIDIPLGGDARNSVVSQRGAIFVALPDRMTDLNQIRNIYPGGAFSQVPRRANPSEILYALYIVPNISP